MKQALSVSTFGAATSPKGGGEIKLRNDILIFNFHLSIPNFLHPPIGDFVKSSKKELTFLRYDIRIISIHYAPGTR